MTLRTLIGPLSPDRARLWDGPRQRGATLAFGPAGVDLPIHSGDSWDQLAAHFPAGWQPDVVVLSLGYADVPPALWDAPVPLVALAPDWQVQWHAFRRLLPRCELVLTDTAGVEVLHRQGIRQARYANLYGLGSSWLEGTPPDEERTIDLLFAGNLNSAVQGERLPWLARLAAFSGQWKVHIATHVFGEEYRALLRRARVVFNRSVRGECNLRVGEALASGCLLFCERDNHEVASVLRDGVEYVAYDTHDLETLLERYLADEPLRRRIAEAGRGRSPEFSFAVLWDRLEASIQEELAALQERRRQRPAWSLEESLLARSWQAVGSGRGADSGLPAALASALLDHPQDATLHNALGLLLARPGGDGRIARDEAQRAAPHFQRAVRANPRHAVAALNLVECLVGLEQTELALQGAQQLLAMLGRAGADEPSLDTLPFPPLYDLLRAQWEKAAWQNAGNPAAEVEAKGTLLRWRLHEILTQLTHGRKGSSEGEPLLHAYEAVIARPELVRTRLALGLLLGSAGQHGEAVVHLRSAYQARPFDRACAFNYFVALQHLGAVVEARKVARQRRALLAAAPGLIDAEDWFVKAPPPGDELASILVLCCNEVEVTRLCLESVLRHTRRPYELILVDNGSRDDTAAYLAGLRSRPGPARVEIISNAENVGYPAGCNQALAQAKGEWLVFLNNDTVVEAGWLDGLIGWATHEWPSVGLVGPVTNRSRPPQEIPVDYTSLTSLPAFAAHRQREYAGKALKVERLTGFCLLARRDVLRQVGGHDEGYGIGFFEDDDLSVRVRQAGYQLLVAQDVFVHHFGNRTFQALGLDTAKLLTDNFQRFQDKWGQGEAAGYQLPPAASLPSDVPVLVGAAGQRARVSLCLIVRNEEANIGDCLRCAADLFDEIIVLDTGSTDRTRELARAGGAQVHDFPWIDNFSAARNACLEHAGGDFIFWLDADDRLDEANRSKLRHLFARLRPGQPVAFSMKCLCLPDPRSGTSTVVDHIRLFPRHPQVRWRYRVHEQILPALRAVGVPVEWADVVIHHTGYQDAALRQRKLERDLRLLEMERADQPDEPFVLFNMGSIFHELGRLAEAIPVLERSLGHSHPKDSIVRKLYALLAQCHSRLGRTQEALAILARGRSIEPDDDELLFLEGLVHKQVQDCPGARQCFQALIQGTAPRPHFASVADGLRGYRPRHELAVLELQEGNFPSAESLWKQVLAERGDYLPAWLGVAEVYLAQSRWPELEAWVARLATLPGGEAEALLLHCRSLLAQRRFAEARQQGEQLTQRWPEWLPGWVTLSHVLLQEDRDHPAAQRVLEEILKRDPQHAQALHNLALLRENVGKQGQPATGSGNGVAANPRPALDVVFAGGLVPAQDEEQEGRSVVGLLARCAAPVRVAVVCITHNEEDLIVPFLDHYLTLGVQHIRLIDNESLDHTCSRARRYPNVQISTLNSGGELDDQLRSDTFQHYRHSLSGSYDWVLLLDADEWLVPREGSLHDTLLRYADRAVLGSEGIEVIQRPDEPPFDPAVPPLRQRRWGVPNPAYNKPIVLRPEGQERLAVGQHFLQGPVPYPADCPFWLFHLAAFDEGIFFKRRLRMTSRQGERNIRLGYSVQHTHQSEADLRRRWEKLVNDPNQRLLPIVGS
jgi:GT2 family glycosyltransferase/tetratricopeptide (TPR) repeat protein